MRVANEGGSKLGAGIEILILYERRRKVGVQAEERRKERHRCTRAEGNQQESMYNREPDINSEMLGGYVGRSWMATGKFISTRWSEVVQKKSSDRTPRHLEKGKRTISKQIFTERSGE